MNVFLNRIREGLLQCGSPGPLLGVAVSGGADSVALLVGLYAIANDEGLDLRVLHLNHELRGDESDADAEFVQQMADELGVPVLQRSVNIARFAESRGLGIEEAARIARYEYFAEMGKTRGLNAIATAHTRDDQVETVLHHLVRGTGLNGLCGMTSRRVIGDSVPVVRPLLAVPRQEIETFLTDVGQEFRTDSTNADARFTRNRIRHVLLPMLEREFNPNVRDAVIRLSEQALESQQSLDFMTDGILRRAVSCRDDEVVELKRRRMADLPDHAVRECFRKIWKQQDWPRQSLNHAHLTTLCRLTREDGAASLPDGVQVATQGAVLRLVRKT